MRFISVGRANAFLPPTRNSLILGLLGGVCASQSVSAIMGRCLKYLDDAGGVRDSPTRRNLQTSHEPIESAEARGQDTEGRKIARL